MKKLKNILLIDDDEITNFINHDLLMSLNITEKVTVLNNGLEALDYLNKARSESDELHTKPDLIFLDINMPVMDGFQFLENYQKIYGDHNGTTIITMLTTSLIKEEVSRALNLATLVQGYIEKPLTKEVVMEIYQNKVK